MKKISKFIKKNIKIVIAFSIGFILAGTSVYAANTVNSKNVTYDNSNSGLSSVNVQDALDELYLKMYPSQFYKKLYESAVRDDRSSTYVSSSDGIDFSEISSNTNGKGLYIASEYSDYKYPILYYRGDVDNNNLIFANFCWKIVRTTETGGIKLIYNGTPDNGVCNATGEDSLIGYVFNTNYNSPAYVGYMYGNVYSGQVKNMIGNTATYYYGNDVTYSNGTYTLKDTISSNWSSIYNGGLNNNHYTCMGGTTCSSVYYIYNANSSSMLYITLTNGKNINDALDDMLDKNIVSSSVKNTVESWYNANIEKKGYSDYVEDTAWCYDRSIRDGSGWDPDGGNTKNYLKFGVSKIVIGEKLPSLMCSRKIDNFTVNKENGNGDLDYPIGLLTADEMVLAGGLELESVSTDVYNTSFYLYIGKNFLSGSPNVFSSIDNNDFGANVFGIYSTGNLSADLVRDNTGVRPSISLAPGVEVSSGNGTENNPYMVG